MATLYDLAMQYLNQSLPKTFKYDRTNQPGTNPILPVQPKEPVKKILPVQNSNNFSVYNPDPSRTRTQDNYNERPYRSTLYKDAFPMMGDPEANQATGALNADGLMSYAGDKQLTGIPAAAADFLGNSFIGKGLDALGNALPFNRRAVYENELLGQGIRLNDIGQIVASPGSINTAQNIMAGYNANKITADTIQNRIDNINENMKDPDQKKAKLEALYEFAKINNIALDRTNTIDSDYVSFDDLLDINNMINTEKEEDENFDPLDPKNKSSIYTATAPTYLDNYPTTITGSGDGTGSGGSYDEAGIDYGDGTGSGGSYDEAGIDYGDGTGSGGSYDEAGINTGSSYNAGSGYNATNKGGPAGQGSPKYGTGSGNLGDYQIQPSNNSGNDGGNTGGSSKIVCTMMNESYGFGSFRNKIWLKHSKGLAPEYQKGYHKLFLPLVKIAKTNKVVRKILEHIAVHRTIDIRQESRGKVHLLGRVYRKILEPLCYFVGKHG